MRKTKTRTGSKVIADDGVLDDGLIAYYPFDGDTNDASGNNNDGIKHGATYVNDGVSGNALSFDGVDDYISTGFRILTDTIDFSVSFWFYYEANDRPNMIGNGYWNKEYGQSSGFGCGVYPDGNFYFFRGAGTEVQSIEVSNGGLRIISWNHIVLTHRIIDDASQIFINGTMKAEGTMHVGENANDEFFIGKRRASGVPDYDFYDGKIDEVKVWNRALNSAEISQLYNNTTN